MNNRIEVIRSFLESQRDEAITKSLINADEFDLTEHGKFCKY